MNQDPLAQLRDIHLPEAIGWWPPAPGWWILTLLLLVSTTFTIRYLIRRRRQRYFRREARGLLTQCWTRYQLKSDHRQFVEDLFTLIRRAHLSSKHSNAFNQAGNKANNNASKDSPDSLVDEHQDQQLKAISADLVFKKLDQSVDGDLSKLVSIDTIQGLLYQQNPEPLNPDQAERLHAAATQYLKCGAR